MYTTFVTLLHEHRTTLLLQLLVALALLLVQVSYCCSRCTGGHALHLQTCTGRELVMVMLQVTHHNLKLTRHGL
jgi:hypothetical protein